MRLCYSAFVALLALCLPLSAVAQVSASLVAADKSVQAGRPVTVALRLEHQRGWHSFWKNPGTGLVTKLQWALPDGWGIGEIQWPVPSLVFDKQGNVSGHGYEGIVYLPVTLTAAAQAEPGKNVSLRATARWLMCETVCIPGKQDVSLELPVTTEPAQPDVDARAELARVEMPKPARGWKLAASESEDAVSLHVAAPSAVNSLRFFPAEKFIAYRQPQTVVNRGNRALLQMGIDKDEARPASSHLGGVLAYVDAGGAYRGVIVDVPFSNAAAAAAAVGTGGLMKQGDSGLSTGSGVATDGLSVGILLLALLGGLVLNLMPCVFPVLGLKIVSFIDQAGSDRRRVTLHALAFTSGVLLSFWVLAGLLAAFRAGGKQLGWGFQLQSPSFVFALAVLMLAFAMNLSGVFEVGLRATALGSRLHSRNGVAGSFFSGMLAAIVATPCSAPFLAPALGVALVLPTGQSLVVFTAVALGLSVPYLLLSLSPRLMFLLPRPGAWMETFKQAMAFLLYATVAYLVWVLAGQVSDNGLLNALLALTLVALALWAYGRFPTVGARSRYRLLRLAGTPALFLFALLVGWPRLTAPNTIAWEPWSVGRVAQLRQEGRAIYVDFTARWCATCQVNKQIVFASEDVRSYFRKYNVATLKADWTNSDPAITAELERWNRSAIPFNLVYPAHGGEGKSRAPTALPEVLTPSIVLRAFKEGEPGSG